MACNLEYPCWEIMNCENLDCPARLDPLTPCWEIARKVEAYHDVSNTCLDCAVYMLKEKSTVADIKLLENLILKSLLGQNTRTSHQACIGSK